jgi:hypothetical protein
MNWSAKGCFPEPGKAGGATLSGIPYRGIVSAQPLTQRVSLGQKRIRNRLERELVDRLGEWGAGAGASMTPSCPCADGLPNLAGGQGPRQELSQESRPRWKARRNVGGRSCGGPSLAQLTALIVNGFFGQVRVWVCKASAELCRRSHQAAGKFGDFIQRRSFASA